MGGRNEMGIKEMEKQTGISSQNIRYYEKQGLLSPKRNPENGYRIYGEEEAEQLKRIKLFRKLDMPIEDIRRMLSREQSLREALTAQKISERDGGTGEGRICFRGFCRGFHCRGQGTGQAGIFLQA